MTAAIRDPFPAHAGMNRTRTCGPRCRQTVPRTRGDEPSTKSAIIASIGRSPHTRG